MRKTRTLADGRKVTVNDNDGIRKRCDCPRRRWATCPHSWYFSFKWKDTHYRFPLDKYSDKHIESREDARDERDRLRRAIRAGQDPTAATTATPTTPADLTFEAFTKEWVKSRTHVSDGQQANDKAIIGRLATIELAPGERLGLRPIGLLTVNIWETVFANLATLSASTRNKYRQALLTMQEWAVDKGYLLKPWLTGKLLKRGGSLARRKGNRRSRRLVPDVVDDAGQITQPGEERRLLQHASPWLQRLIIAALECGGRRGELLSLRWADVDLSRREMTFRAENTKTRTARTVPISPDLLAVLRLIQHDPAGNPHKPTAYVLGNAIGGKVGSPKKAWLACCRKAGISDLHFHDLRREYGSRLLDRGWPLSAIKELLGHTNVSTTDIYLGAGLQRLHDHMKRYGTGGQPLHIVAQTESEEPQPLGNGSVTTESKSLVN